eukprot:2471416-Rhodomonas_salina.1
MRASACQWSGVCELELIRVKWREQCELLGYAKQPQVPQKRITMLQDEEQAQERAAELQERRA